MRLDDRATPRSASAERSKFYISQPENGNQEQSSQGEEGSARTIRICRRQDPPETYGQRNPQFATPRRSDNHRDQFSSANICVLIKSTVQRPETDAREVSALTILPVLGRLEVVGGPACTAAAVARGRRKTRSGRGRRRKVEAQVEGGGGGDGAGGQREPRHGRERRRGVAGPRSLWLLCSSCASADESRITI